MLTISLSLIFSLLYIQIYTMQFCTVFIITANLLFHINKKCTFTTARKVINYIPVEMSRSEVINYFRSVLRTKISSMDRVNEEVYSGETFPEDLYHSIDNLMPRPNFVRYLLKTKNITDKNDQRGNSMIQHYPGVLNIKCNPSTFFNHSVTQILKDWEGDKSIIYDDLEKWQASNMLTSYNQVCNRFRGLTCQYKIAKNEEADQGEIFETTDSPTCQCAGDSKNVGFFYTKVKKHSAYYSSAELYPDGCYVRPWKSCRHLSLDYAFREYYESTVMAYQKTLLSQMVFPLPRTHRCKQGTYCLDLIPGMKKPICWCNENNDDPTCLLAFKNNSKTTVIPLGSELAAIRRNFVKLFITVNDSTGACDPQFNDEVEKIANGAGTDPSKSGILMLMKELIDKRNDIKICDFRRSFYCDTKTRKCQGRCEPGRIHLGKGVCAVDNGFACQTNEDCVEKAKCKQIRGTLDKICVCEKGYGSRCRLQNPSFFGRLFNPIVSGFREGEFVKLQEKIESILESWEDSMNKNEGEVCDPATDQLSMEIVEYFGNLEKYENVKGDKLLTNAKTMIQHSPKLCHYTKFLRCDPSKQKCVPIVGSNIIPNSAMYTSKTNLKILEVTVQPGEECGRHTLPKIFHEGVQTTCINGYECRVENGGKGICSPDCNSPLAPHRACPVTVTRSKNESESTIETYAANETVNKLAENKTAVTGKDDDDDRFWDNDQVEVEDTNIAESLPNLDTILELYDKGISNHTAYINNPSPWPHNLKKTVPKTVHEVKPKQPVSYSSTETSKSNDKTLAMYDDICMYNSNDEKSKNLPDDLMEHVCDSELYLHCHHNKQGLGVCRCHPPLVYSEQKNKCTIPIGTRCDRESLTLPKLMKFEQLECNFGVCKKDNAGMLCKPKKDLVFLVVPFHKKE